MIAIRRNRERVVEAEGFRDGSQEVSPDAAQQELHAHFAQRQERVRDDAANDIKKLEARIETLGQRKTDGEKHWRDIENKVGAMPPQIALPLLAVILAGLAVVGETVLLAPVMAGFGIADPLLQQLTAAVLVLVSSGLLELTIRQIHHSPNDKDSGLEGNGSTNELEPAQHRLLRTTLTASLTILAFALVFVLGASGSDDLRWGFAAKRPWGFSKSERDADAGMRDAVDHRLAGLCCRSF